MFSWTSKLSALFSRSLARGVPISEPGRDPCVAALPSHRAVVFGALEKNYPIFSAIWKDEKRPRFLVVLRKVFFTLPFFPSLVLAGCGCYIFALLPFCLLFVMASEFVSSECIFRNRVSIFCGGARVGDKPASQPVIFRVRHRCLQFCFGFCSDDIRWSNKGEFCFRRDFAAVLCDLWTNFISPSFRCVFLVPLAARCRCAKLLLFVCSYPCCFPRLKASRITVNYWRFSPS